jgi:hypothetical protein
MKDDEIKHEIEQGGVEKEMEDLAGRIGGYYCALISSGIPENLAQMLTMDYSDKFWHSMFCEACK